MSAARFVSRPLNIVMKSLLPFFVRRALAAASGIALCGLAVFAMAGCGVPNGARPPSSAMPHNAVPPNGAEPVLRAAARAALIGKFYDRALWAAEQGHKAAFRAAHGELQRLGAKSEALAVAQRMALSPAEEAIAKAISPQLSLAEYVQLIFTGRLPANLDERAAQQYRLALRLSPQFDSLDPLKLNALGYFLAERGTTAEDFAEAERLTRAALRLLDEALAQQEKRGGTAPLVEEMRANVRDSVAWALFRQGRLNEALREQQRAVKEAKDSEAKGATAVSAEMYFHLGEMLRALGHLAEARAQYQAALKADPNHLLSRQALQSIGPQTQPAPRLTNPTTRSV